jgi:hypothetical protein
MTTSRDGELAMSFGIRIKAAIAAALCLALAAAEGCASGKPGTYKTPEEAVEAVAALIGTNDAAAVEIVFGPGSVDVLKSGDEVADREDYQRVKTMILEKVAFEDVNETTKVALFGNER